MLVAVTIAYVRLTGRLADEASRSAKATEESAKGTQRAAQAMERSVLLAEAQLGVGFDVLFEEVEDNTPDQWIAVAARGPRVSVHGVAILGAYHDEAGDIQLVSAALEPMHPPEDEMPALLQGDRRAIFRWPGRRVDTSATNTAVAFVSHSVTGEEEPSTYERNIGFPNSQTK